MIYEFTDTDYCVIVDSLGIARERIQSEGRETPDIDAAIAKMSAWAQLVGCEFIVIAGGNPDVNDEITGLAAEIVMAAKCPHCGHVHDHEWTLCENCCWDSAR